MSSIKQTFKLMAFASLFAALILPASRIMTAEASGVPAHIYCALRTVDEINRLSQENPNDVDLATLREFFFDSNGAVKKNVVLSYVKGVATPETLAIVGEYFPSVYCTSGPYTHYANTGLLYSSVLALLGQTGNDEDVAFGLGFLVHYVVDSLTNPILNELTGGEFGMPSSRSVVRFDPDFEPESYYNPDTWRAVRDASGQPVLELPSPDKNRDLRFLFESGFSKEILLNRNVTENNTSEICDDPEFYVVPPLSDAQMILIMSAYNYVYDLTAEEKVSYADFKKISDVMYINSHANITSHTHEGIPCNYEVPFQVPGQVLYNLASTPCATVLQDELHNLGTVDGINYSTAYGRFAHILDHIAPQKNIGLFKKAAPFIEDGLVSKITNQNLALQNINLDTGKIATEAENEAHNVPNIGEMINPRNTQAFITSKGSGNLSRWVIKQNGEDTDIEPNSYINIGNGPTGITFDSTGRFAWIANTQDGSISWIDTQNGQEIDQDINDGLPISQSRLKLGISPTELAITGDGARLYVINQAPASVSVVDLLRRDLIGSIDISTNEELTDIAISSTGLHAYVSIKGNPGQIAVMEIGTQDSEDPPSIPHTLEYLTLMKSKDPSGIALDPQDKNLYIVNKGVHGIKGNYESLNKIDLSSYSDLPINPFIHGSPYDHVIKTEIIECPTILLSSIMDELAVLKTPMGIFTETSYTDGSSAYGLTALGGGALFWSVASLPSFINLYYKINPVWMHAGSDVGMPSFTYPSLSIPPLLYESFLYSGNIGIVNRDTDEFFAATSNKIGEVFLSGDNISLDKLAVSELGDAIALMPATNGFIFLKGKELFNTISRMDVDLVKHPIDEVNPNVLFSLSSLVNNPRGVDIQPIVYPILPVHGEKLFGDITDTGAEIDCMIFSRIPIRLVDLSLNDMGNLIPLITGSQVEIVQRQERFWEFVIRDTVHQAPFDHNGAFELVFDVTTDSGAVIRKNKKVYIENKAPEPYAYVEISGVPELPIVPGSPDLTQRNSIPLFDPSPFVELDSIPNPGTEDNPVMTFSGTVKGYISPIEQVMVENEPVTVTQLSQGPDDEGPFEGEFSFTRSIGNENLSIMVMAQNALNNIGFDSLLILVEKDPNGNIIQRIIIEEASLPEGESNIENYTFSLHVLDTGLNPPPDEIKVLLNVGLNSENITLYRHGDSYKSEEIILLPENFIISDDFMGVVPDICFKTKTGSEVQVIYQSSFGEYMMDKGMVRSPQIVQKDTLEPIDIFWPTDLEYINNNTQYYAEVGFPGIYGETMDAYLVSLSPSRQVIHEQAIVLIRQSNDTDSPQYNLYRSEKPIIGMVGSIPEGMSEEDFEDYILQYIGYETQIVMLGTPYGIICKPANRLLYAVPFTRIRTLFNQVNDTMCPFEGFINYLLTEDAEVTINIRTESGAIVYTVNQVSSRGWTQLPLTIDEVPIGGYEFDITATSIPHPDITDRAKGRVVSELRTCGNLPVGHTFVKDVDLQTGHVVISREDINIPGRGAHLQFIRSYSNNGNASDGPLGAGWTHNYDSKLIITPCNEYIVVGGEGSGQTFRKNADGSFTPEPGFHTRLVQNEDGSYDFFTKGGVRYHYKGQFSLIPNLQYIECPNGNRTTLEYDLVSYKDVVLTKVTDSSGRTLEFSYDHVFGADRIVKITGPLNLRIQYEYDDKGNLVKAMRGGVNGKTEEYEYTIGHLKDEHNLIKIVDPRGHTTEYQYYTLDDGVPGEWYSDPVGLWMAECNRGIPFHTKYELVHYIHEPEGVTTTFEYDYINQTRAVTNGRGYKSRYTLNCYGSVTQMEDPFGNNTTTVWAMDLGIDDVYMLEKTDAEGNTTEYDYDENGNLTKTTDALGNVSEAVYELTFNKPVSITDANGHTTFHSYDDNGNLIETTDPEGGKTTHAYAANGDRLSTTDPVGNTMGFTYDQYGNISRAEDPEGGVMTNEYDARSRLIRSVDGNDHQTVYIYDDFDRVTERIDALGYSTKYTYDNNGNKISETDANGHKTTYKYDGLNRLMEEIDALGNSMSVIYDKNNNKIKLIDKRGKTTQYFYDGLDRLIKQINACGKEKTFSYNNVGNRISEVDYNGHATTSVYDKLYRIIQITDALSNITSYEYDNVGNKTKDIDPLNHETIFVYDAANRLVTKIDALGNASTIEYDAVGNKIKETDRNGHSTYYTYDGKNRLISIKDHLGYTISYTYDNFGNKLTETNQNGNTTQYEYDALNRLVKKTDPLGFSTEITYDPVGNVTTVKDARENETLKEYDALNRLTTERVIDPATGEYASIAYTYDENGNRLTETNRRGFTYHSAYDNLNRPISFTDPLGKSVTFEYDGEGNKTKETDKRGIVTTFVYDALNRLSTETRAGITIRSYQYDAVGNKIQETDANGHTTYFQYDELNRMVNKIEPLNTTTSYTYDNERNKLTEVNPEAHVTTFSYDALNRLISIEDAEFNVTGYEYDGVGNKTKHIEPMGDDYLTQYVYDKNNRLIKVIDAFGNATEYTYDGNGNRLSQKDANGYQVSYEYDSLDRQTRMVQHGSNGDLTTQYAYDANGNRTVQIDPKGQKITFAYDSLDRLIQKSYPPPRDIIYPYIKSISYQYDENNNETRIDEVKINSSSGASITETTQKGYDNFDRLTSVIDRDNNAILYAYDQVGNRTSITDPDGKVTTYEYDELNRLIAAQTEEGITHYTYYPDGEKKEILYPNGTQAEYEYDTVNRATMIYNHSDTETISLYRYTYDKNGNRLAMEEIQEGVTENSTYEYDFCNRLVKVIYPIDEHYPSGRQVIYTYDDVGNRLSETETDYNGQTLVSKSYTYDELNRLLSITDNLGSDHVSYAYDNNGNTISKTKGGVTTAFRYDVRNQLRIANDGVSNLASFDYNYQGMRIIKSGNDGVVRYVYDDRAVLTETDDYGNTIAKYNYADRLLSITHHVQGTQFYLFSALGSVSNLTNVDGSLKCSYQYDAWGNFRKKSDNSWNKKTFTGKEWDEETGLFYFGARFYDPEIGRFITQDEYLGEINTPPSLHRYLYAYGNPLRYIDLLGYFSWSETFDEISNKASNWLASGKEFWNKHSDVLDPVMKTSTYFMTFGYDYKSWFEQVEKIVYEAPDRIKQIGLKDYTEETILRMIDVSYASTPLGKAAQVIRDARAFYETNTPTNAWQVAGFATATTLLQLTEGVVTSPKALASQVVEWGFDPLNYNKIPILGPLGQALGESYARATLDPSVESISVAFGQTCFAFTTALGGVQLARTLGVPGTYGNRPIQWGRGNEGGDIAVQESGTFTKAEEFEGVKVYKRTDIDWDMVDMKGRTNIQRAQQGLSPLGKDGQPINLHHIGQDPGAVAETTQSIHQKYYSTLHKKLDESLINRHEFNAWKRHYWKQRIQ